VESPALMTWPLVALAVLSLVGGALNLPGAFAGSHVLAGWLARSLDTAESAGFNWFVAGLSLVLSMAAFGLAFLLYRRHPATAKKPDPLQDYIGDIFIWLQDKWYIDEIYAGLILKPYDGLSWLLANVVDARFWHDWFHDKLVGGLVRALSGAFRRLQSGDVRNYALAMFVGVLAVLGYFLLGK
jgi:NADH-quinone oxidoreductase subunit L